MGIREYAERLRSETEANMFNPQETVCFRCLKNPCECEANAEPPFSASNGSALVAEVERLRKRNSELQRRCQQAESAVAKFKCEWDKHGGPRGGSFGRALLACYCADLERKLEAQND